MTQAQPPAVASAAPRKTRGPCLLCVSGVVVSALLVAIAVWHDQPSPTIVAKRVLVDGSRDRGEVVATIEAEYHEPASLHRVGIDGGSCEIVTACAAAQCPVLRAAVRPPRRLEEGRVAIDAVVTELWPARVRKAVESDGGVDCVFTVHVDVLKTGWRVERELHWSLANAGAQTTVSVTPQKVTPEVRNGTLTVDASYIFQAQLALGSALGELLRSVPVAMRAEFAYVEQSEGAMQGGFLIDAELDVTAEADTGRVVVAAPFATTTSASLASLAKYTIAAGKSPQETPAGAGGEVTGALEHGLVFAAAPHAPATASLLGGAHEVAWSRNFSFTDRSESGRRLDGRRLLQLPQDLSLLHRFRIDDKEVLEVLIALSAGSPAEASVRVRSGATFADMPFKDVFSFAIRSDNILQPAMSMGHNGAGLVTELGNFSTSQSGSAETVTWKGNGMGAVLTRNGNDLTVDLQLPENMTGALSLKAGVVTGSLTSGDKTVAKLNGAMKAVAPGSNDQRLDATLEVDGQDPVVVAADFKMAQHFGGQVVGSIAWGNGTKIGSADAKLEAVASGDTTAYLVLREGEKADPAIDFKFALKATQPACGLVVTSLKGSGKQVFSADLGCTRSPVSDDFKAHAVVKTEELQPTLFNSSVDFVSKPVFGGDLKVQAAVHDKPIFKAAVAAAESGALRSVDATLAVADQPENKLNVQFTKPGAVDVRVEGAFAINGTDMVKCSIAGKAVDHVIATQVVEKRREFVVANPGVWNASVSVREDDKNALVEAFKVGASLARVQRVTTFEVRVPDKLTATAVMDGTQGSSVAVAAALNGFEEENGTKFLKEVANVNGTMKHVGDMFAGTLTLFAGSFSQAVDLGMSRGFIAQPDSTYKMNVSATAKVPEMKMEVRLEDAYVSTYSDWSMSGGGWGLKLLDSNGTMQLVQGVDLGMAPPPVPAGTAVKVSGSMSVKVEGDVAAFVADPAVKHGFQKAIADTVGVPSNSVKVKLSVARRLSETRRLNGAVKVDYEIVLPQEAEAATVSNALMAAPPAELTTKVMAVVAEESGGSSPYTMTVTDVSTPTVYRNDVEVTSRAPGARASLPAAVLIMAGAARAM